MKQNKLIIGFLLIGAISMLIMSLHYFSPEASGILKNKLLKDTLWYRFTFCTHIAFGLVAILLGPFQFIDSLVQKRSRIHKKIGYTYSLAVAISSLAGLVIAQFAMGGMITRVGFSCLSIIWFYSLFLALKSVFAGDIVEHEKWMKINYALTFSSITQRTILLFAFLPALSFMPVYQLSSWLSWILNLSIVLFFISKRSYQPAFS